MCTFIRVGCSFVSVTHVGRNSINKSLGSNLHGFSITEKQAPFSIAIEKLTPARVSSPTLAHNIVNIRDNGNIASVYETKPGCLIKSYFLLTQGSPLSETTVKLRNIVLYSSVKHVKLFNYELNYLCHLRSFPNRFSG